MQHSTLFLNGMIHSQLSVNVGKAYELIPISSTYAHGKVALQKACEKETNSPHSLYTLPDGYLMYRPLTFRENVQARVDDFYTLKDKNGKRRSLEDRTSLFMGSVPLTSCTSVAYKAKTTLFTIIPLDHNLITLPLRFQRDFLLAAYPSSVSIELDSKRGKYDQPLSKKEVYGHEGWILAVEEDRALLKELSTITFSLLKKRYGIDKGMGFYVDYNQPQDLRRALILRNLDDESNVRGGYNLDNSCSFLQVIRCRYVWKN